MEVGTGLHATWVKQVIRAHIKAQKRKAVTDSN